MDVEDADDPILDEIAKLWARGVLTPVIRWGTVTSGSPLRVILDGSTEPLPFAPQTTVRDLSVGDRVVCVEQHRRVIVLSVPSAAPYGVAAGSFLHTSTIPADGGFEDVSITFPAGRFTVAPIVLAGASSVRLNVSALPGVTSTGCTLRIFNPFSLDVTSANIRWHATQMRTGGAGG